VGDEHRATSGSQGANDPASGTQGPGRLSSSQVLTCSVPVWVPALPS
jgi:hypothetical protein